MKWQPIKTVPKDGMRILLYFACHGVRTGLYWRTYRLLLDCGLASSLSDKGGVEPTHWMPLPEPPEDEE